MGSINLDELSDQKIIEVGHKAWIKRHKAEDHAAAEEQYAIALGNQVNLKIAHRTDFQLLSSLSIIFANITKGAYRLSDYLNAQSAEKRLFTMKAARLSNQAMMNILTGRTNDSITKHSDVWGSYRKLKIFHLNNRAQIDAYFRSGSGYSHEVFWAEYEALGQNIERAVNIAFIFDYAQKSNVFFVCLKMIELTSGVDPDPYDLSENSI